ncbi:hypothetical protein MMU07_16445 [Aquiflexum sp. LQ15W]|uniref:hypothetical protein n=1 Tax=Cognataquiflexum nitidum TaxID=2922272 RepID=UPI001F148EBA|nr:hypothetical protein [Cognataquiflexum nitidum]MCH6201177.1 hypothetical protein [Cognataquiflexum nitidum]
MELDLQKEKYTMKKPGFFLLFIMLWSCFGDVDKDISTDLQFEGIEIFGVSLSLEESLFFPFQTIDYYRLAESLEIPGCPDVTIDENLKKVTLAFSVKKECVNNLYAPRSGKIHLQYISNSIVESTVRMEYEDYSVRGIKIEGFREFKRANILLNPNRRTESFQDLFIIDGNKSSTRITGNYTHQLIVLNGILTGFSSTGDIEGRNIAGRSVRMTQTVAKSYNINCIKNGFLLPGQGSENWGFFRNESQATNHRLVYTLENQCNSIATITLEDGRLMVFRLAE